MRFLISFSFEKSCKLYICCYLLHYRQNIECDKANKRYCYHHQSNPWNINMLGLKSPQDSGSSLYYHSLNSLLQMPLDMLSMNSDKPSRIVIYNHRNRHPCNCKYPLCWSQRWLIFDEHWHHIMYRMILMDLSNLNM